MRRNSDDSCDASWPSTLDGQGAALPMKFSAAPLIMTDRVCLFPPEGGRYCNIREHLRLFGVYALMGSCYWGCSPDAAGGSL